jgi:error-prone DNA polymerase
VRTGARRRWPSTRASRSSPRRRAPRRARGPQLTDALSCLREHTHLDAAGRRLAANAEQHLQPGAAIAQRFADRPQWIRATRAIAERCAFTLENLGYRFPEFPIPPGESQASFLRILTEYGARERYGTRYPCARAASSSTSSP